MSGHTTSARSRLRRSLGALGFAAALGISSATFAPWADADDIGDVADAIAGSAAAVAPDVDPGIDTVDAGSSLDLHDPVLPAAAADPGAAASTPDTVTVPLQVAVHTEPVINASIGGGHDISVLVDSGANGMIVPWQDFGWQDIAWNKIDLFHLFGIGSFSGGMSYLYLTLPTSVDFGGGAEATDAPVNLVLFSWWTNPTSLEQLLFPPSINQFLAGAANGIFGIGPNAFGPGPGVMSHLPGDLGQGVLIDQPAGKLTFGSADSMIAAGLLDKDDMTVVDGSPIASLKVSIDDGPLQSVQAIIDSGGVFGTMPNTVQGLELDNGVIPTGTNIAVYTKDGDLLYSYSTGGTYSPDNGVVPSPTVIGGSNALMNTGNYPFTQGPIFIGQGGTGSGSQTIFGWLPSNP